MVVVRSQRVVPCALLVCCALLPTSSASAQVVDPSAKAAAEAAKQKQLQLEQQQAAERSDEVELETDLDHARGRAPRLRSWEQPARDDVVVTAERLGALREEDRIGSYGQPRWTAQRLFPATRVYVRPKGTFGVEHWTRVKTPRHGGDRTVETQYEVEFGLPGRVQLDLYQAQEKTGHKGELDTSANKYEIRWALADWGEIWGNPTLYYEYVQRDAERDMYEAKLLLGGEIDEGWHWGTNLVVEREFGSMPETVYELTAGVSHVIEDEVLSLGCELKAAAVDAHDGNGSQRAHEFEIGPTMRWNPLPEMHIDFAPLIGIGPDSRRSDVYLVLGWEF